MNTCGRCGKELKSERAKRAGYGRKCRTLVLKAQREAATAAFTPDQINKAQELIEDAAIIRVRPGIYIAVSGDGSTTYRCAKQGCTCPASKPCYHQLAVRVLEAAGKAPELPREPFVMPNPERTAPMSLNGLNPSEELHLDPEFGPRINAELLEIMSVGPEFASEEALYDLIGTVADALHTGKVDFPEHDALIQTVRDSLDTLI